MWINTAIVPIGAIGCSSAQIETSGGCMMRDHGALIHEVCLGVGLTLFDRSSKHVYCFTGGVHRRDKGWAAAFNETGRYGNY